MIIQVYERLSRWNNPCRMFLKVDNDRQSLLKRSKWSPKYPDDFPGELILVGCFQRLKMIGKVFWNVQNDRPSIRMTFPVKWSLWDVLKGWKWSPKSFETFKMIAQVSGRLSRWNNPCGMLWKCENDHQRHLKRSEWSPKYLDDCPGKMIVVGCFQRLIMIAKVFWNSQNDHPNIGMTFPVK